MARLHLSFVCLLSALLIGCTAGAGTRDGSAAPRRQSNLISAEEVRETQLRSAYELIQSLRPNWLHSRGPQSLTNPSAGMVMVYLDGTRAGTVEFLRQISTQDVQTARYLNGSEATARFGTDHGGGAILVSTRRQ